MAIPVIMPKLGQSVESCIVTEWFKKKGDEVKKGDLLLSVETDKALMEIAAEAEGVLLEIFFNEGDEVPVLTNIAVLGKKGEPAEEFRPRMNAQQGIPKSELKEHAGKKEDHFFTKTETHENTGEIFISPRAKKLAEKLGVPVSKVKGTGPSGRIIESDIENYAKSNPLITHTAKEKAKSEDIFIHDAGTGAGGRITANDLSEQSTDEFIIKPVSNVRKIISQEMYEALQNSAQLTLHTSANATKLTGLRNMVKEKRKANSNFPNITINDMVCFAVVKSLVKYPEMNSHFLESRMKTFKNVHLGFAVDVKRGLMVPVIKNADTLSIKELSFQINDIANKCKENNITPDLLSGASFTITNLGAFDIEMFTPVLSPPQVGILGVNAITYRPVADDNGKFDFAPYMGLSLTFDHRALDGAPAAKFLRDVKKEIENLDINL